MINFQSWGKILIFTGIIIALIGGIITFFGEKLSWFGNLPGDIKIEKENFKLYFPITTMVIISLLINGFIYLLKFLFRFF